MITKIISSNFRLAILSGLLLALSFPHIGGMNLVALVALIPLLLAEDRLSEKKRSGWSMLGLGYLAFFVYNLLTTWWIYFADPIGAIMAVLANSLLMALAFWVFHFAKKNIGRNQGYLAFVFIWMAFEYQHFNWELSWPWLSFGNVFANAPILVQWYEWTGVTGGTLWVLVVNLLIYKLLRNRYVHRQEWSGLKRMGGLISLVVLLPIVGSIIRYVTYDEKKNPVDIVVTQPNIDPYVEKFGPQMLSWQEQLDRITISANKVIDSSVDFVLAPETAIPFELDEATFSRTIIYEYLDSVLQSWNGPDLLIGASTVRIFDTKNSYVSRLMKDGRFYESYNTSVHMGRNHPLRFVHKSKLVLGVEKIPFASMFPFLENFALDLGGASGSLGVEEKAVTLEGKGVEFASLVCYESVYGDFVSQFVNEGAEILFVITNDGWWKDTPGYKQHFDFSRLRAIETRRSVARSANTGISGFINQRGDVIQKSGWDEQIALRQTLNLNAEQTIYATYGDILGRVSWFVTMLIMILTVVRYLRKFGTKTPYGGREE
ncbi:apolipoprotein N-acyltransferase [Wandonia haliotis]|uniref:apolipoprotein N-acyltransferase n=1 Tax=Wandonia haliotis TaxID=574963 RepID=UPI0031D83278